MKLGTVISALTAAVLSSTGAAWAAVPVVSDVNMGQILGTRKVLVTYNLGGADAIVTLSIETNGVAIPDSAVTRLTGDVCKKVAVGTDLAITWDAGADWPENMTESAKARVTAWSVDAPPQYCVIDLSAGFETNSYPVSYYVSAEALPNGGLINDLYRTVRLAMRRIRTGTAYPEDGVFMMGSPSIELYRDSNKEEWHQVTLTKDFYTGVYPVTQSQWQQVMGDVRPWPALCKNADYRLMRPVEQVSHDDIRGPFAGAGWPGSNAVDSNTFIRRLRDKAGLAGFDLPTEAQWEYACRAGTAGALNDGTPNLTSSTSDAKLDLLGRYQYNGGKLFDGVNWSEPSPECALSNATEVVGSYPPNAWGVYDMHGNVEEWCLDRYTVGLGEGAVVDPVGADSGADRVMRGGSWYEPAWACRSARRNNSGGTTSRYGSFGFRLVMNLP